MVLVNAKVSGNRLERAVLVLRADQAFAVVVCYDKFHGDAPGLVYPGCVRMHNHSCCCRCCARSDKPAHPLDLHETQAASAERLQGVIVAQGRDIYVCTNRRLKHGCA
jgi:hypothetical protein